MISRCRSKVAQRSAPKATDEELEYGIPLFLDQLVKTLEVEQTSDPMRSRQVSGPSGGEKPARSEMGKTAVLHGRELLRQGFTIDQVVHDYGDLCQAITDLAFEREEPIETDEFRTLNRCLDNGIADAVTEFTSQRDFVVADNETNANERLGFFAHELRNHLNSASLALHAIKAGNVGVAGATSAVLDRSLVGMRNLIDRSLTEVRMTAGMPTQRRLFSLAEFIAEIRVSALLEAQAKECGFTVSAVDQGLAVDADRDLLLSAVGNLLQNAFKFTRLHTEVTLKAHATANRILIDIEDHGDGLSPADAEKMFQPFAQGNKDKSGMGLGLSISQQCVEANDGVLSVRSVLGSGCVFTIDIPRHALPEPSSVTPAL